MDPIRWCRETFRYYVGFKKDILVNILVYTFIARLAAYDLATYMIVLVFVAHVADVYTGRITMVVLSSMFCIMVLSLHFHYLVGTNNNEQVDSVLFYCALAGIASVGAAQIRTLQELLVGEFRQPDLNENERQRYPSAWWTLVSFVAPVFAQFGPLLGLHFRKFPLVLMAVMMFCLLVLFLDNRWIQDSYLKVPHFPELRSKLSALWFCLLILGLVSASGMMTFSFLDARRLDNYDDLSTIILLDILVRVTELLVSESSSYLVRKLSGSLRFNQGKTELVRMKMELVKIGLGMWFCVLCCILAGATATHRKYDTGGMMSVYWLIPQFFVLGVMAGLAKNGFKSLYASQVPENLKRYGQLYGESAWGAGSLLCMLLYVILSRLPFKWFWSDLSNSSLHDYYALLAFLSLMNLVIFGVVAFSYIRDGGPTIVSLSKSGDITTPRQEDTLSVGHASTSIQRHGIHRRSHATTRATEAPHASSRIHAIESFPVQDDDPDVICHEE